MSTLEAARARLRPPRGVGLLAGVAMLAAGGAIYAQLAPGDRGVPPIDSSSNLEVTGVAVDVVAKDAITARTAGWREAQRRGWKMLWARIHGSDPAAAPSLPDSTLDSMVAGIEVESEEAGPRRYVAKLGILFDRARAGGLLGVQGQAIRSAPMLLVPVMWIGGTAQSFESRTEWQKAWARFRAGASAIDYVRPVGNGADPVLLNAMQARRPGRGWWRMLLDQYGAGDVLTAEVYIDRRYPGGPMTARFVGRHGPDGAIVSSFTLNDNAADGETRLFDEGVRRLDQDFTAALREGRLIPDASLVIEQPETLAPAPIDSGEDDTIGEIVANLSAQAYTLQVETPDAGSVGQVEAALRSVPGVGAAQTTSLAIGGVSLVRVTFNGEVAALRLALAARGWRLDDQGGTLMLRRQPAAIAPVAAPLPAPPR